VTERPDSAPGHNVAEARVAPSRRVSIIWIVPLVALIVGGWLGWKAWLEKGLTITISFSSAEGIEAGKTAIKYKDVEVGQVKDIRLSPDLDRVIVTASVDRDAQPYLTNRTRFWVVRARVAAGEVSGLTTLFSGAYIGMDPVTDGEPPYAFVGLDKPPAVTTDSPGKTFHLVADNLGSLDIGSPVHYRQIRVGQVIDYALAKDGSEVDVVVFIYAPYDEQVRTNSRFWNTSGVSVAVDTEGIKIDTESLVSILLGGIAFDSPVSLETAFPAEEGARFRLYGKRADIREREYSVKRHFVMHFDQSVRGLEKGAPVEFRGIRIGEVVDVKLVIDVQRFDVRVPVLVMIEPERIEIAGGDITAPAGREPDTDAETELVRQLVERGLRARLKTGNLLTGQLYVDLDFYRNAPKAFLTQGERYPVFPTVPTPLEQLTESVTAILKKLESIPYEEISSDIRTALAALNRTLQKTEALATNVNDVLVPDIQKSLLGVEASLEEFGRNLGSGSALSQSTRQAIDELTGTIRSLRGLTDYLERNPDALIFGREGNQP